MRGASIEKKGRNQAFAYTLKYTLEKNKTEIAKRRSISAAEFINLKQYKIKEMNTLIYHRICTMKNGLYMIIDYYPHVEN